MATETACPLCGRKFTCARDVGCWCGTVDASREALQLLEADEGCVCPRCLGGQLR
jgi:hypothetical protein